MISQPVRSGLRTGVTFSVIIIFLMLIGFTVTGSLMLSRFFGAELVGEKGSQIPPVEYLALFIGLLGIWMGATSSKVEEPDSYLRVMVASGTSGLVSGALVFILAFIFGTINAGGTDVREYLAQVSPPFVKFFLFNQDALTGALIHFALLVGTGLVGGLIARFFGRSDWRKKLGKSMGDKIQTAIHLPAVARTRQSIYLRILLIVIMFVALFFLPRMWGSYWNYIMGTVGIYVLLGLGLNLIVGLSGQLVLGYVAFFAVGAYSVALLTSPEPHHLQWGFWPAVVAGILLAALSGILIGLPILRLRGDYLAIVTLGFGEIIRILSSSDILTDFTGGPRGVRNIAGPDLFGKSFTSDVDYMYLIIIAVIIAIFITTRLQNSRTGRAWVAMREDELVARATGVNLFYYKILALALGAAFAGLGGILFASRNQFTGPEDHALMVSINVLSLLIVGGMGSVPGIILGAFTLKGLPEILRELENYRMLVFGGLLVIMMILRPEGLWPGRRPRMEKNGTPQEKKEEKNS